ncbi:MAG: glutathione S-transferase N-terminal domain-containing protein [Solirubrobacterales bacterium]
MSDLILYRCPTRTNYLCPCGAVERRLQRLGLEHETRRVPYRRAARPEIEELTKQRRVPLLVDGEEVVHDSRRILQYLEWRYGKPEKRRKEKRRRRLYNLKRGDTRDSSAADRHGGGEDP